MVISRQKNKFYRLWNRDEAGCRSCGSSQLIALLCFLDLYIYTKKISKIKTVELGDHQLGSSQLFSESCSSQQKKCDEKSILKQMNCQRSRGSQNYALYIIDSQWLPGVALQSFSQCHCCRHCIHFNICIVIDCHCLVRSQLGSTESIHDPRFSILTHNYSAASSPPPPPSPPTQSSPPLPY